MIPVIPHLSYECLSLIDNKEKMEWPKVKKEFLKSDKKTIVIQINGKKRSIILVEENMSEKLLLNEIKKEKVYEKYIKDKKIIKTIFIKDKLLNIIVK